MRFNRTPEQLAAQQLRSINGVRRKRIEEFRQRIIRLAKLPQPVSKAQVLKVFATQPSNLGTTLTAAGTIPWIEVETLPGPRYRIQIDTDLKNLCESYTVGSYSESPHDFLERLLSELRRRRKEAEVKSHGNWVPEQTVMLDLVVILDWIQRELEGFTHHGHTSMAVSNNKPIRIPGPMVSTTAKHVNGREKSR